MRLTSARPHHLHALRRSHRDCVTRLVGATLLVGTAVLAPLGARALAGEGTTGSLEGSVRTVDGAALPHVVLALQGPGGTRRLATGPDATFRAEGLPPGHYAATVDAPGLDVVPPASAVVDRGKRARLDLVLAPAPVTWSAAGTL